MINNLSFLLKLAQKRKFAVPAFNVYNLETIQAVTQAAEVELAPIILAVSEKAIAYAGLNPIIAIVKSVIEGKKIKVALHLDHGRSFEIAKKAIAAGFTSVMFDGSSLPLKENIKITQEIVAYAHRCEVSVEGEVGSIGGQEDYVKGQTISLASSNEVYQFVEQTNVDAVACGLGTSHGLPVPDERVDFNLLDEITAKVAAPIVLHGASNLPDQILKKAVKNGVAKINFDTELRQAFTTGVREELADSKIYDPREYLATGRERVVDRARKIIRLLSANNKLT